jgi:hypothetical protein
MILPRFVAARRDGEHEKPEQNPLMIIWKEKRQKSIEMQKKELEICIENQRLDRGLQCRRIKDEQYIAIPVLIPEIILGVNESYEGMSGYGIDLIENASIGDKLK